MPHYNPPERITQDRVIRLLREILGYDYLGNWVDRPNNSNIEEDLLTDWLKKREVDETLFPRVLYELRRAASLGEGRNLYEANRAVYTLLRYGVEIREAGEKTRRVHLIDWEHPAANHFAVAEEVSIRGENRKRPDLVIYVNGIALGVLELKRSTVSVTEGIRQNLSNQQQTFIRDFFATVQLVMAGNDTEGLRYGVIETPEKYYLQWKEENPAWFPGAAVEKYLPLSTCPDGETILDCALLRLLEKGRFLELIHDFIAYDSGRKKIARPNQYFAVRAAQKRVAKREGGIIWHTQGSGKSLTMVWLARWLREHVENARILIITDRVELDEQIESDFKGVGENIHRTYSGSDLIRTLNDPRYFLVCSLIHKFGRQGSQKTDEQALEDYIADIRRNLPKNFKPKGEIFVFVDECHRTQSGKLHQAMKAILPNAMFIGFTGTPLLKTDKQKSVEIFGSYIHTYKYDEAVRDGVVLDLAYESRDIDQRLTSPDRIDQWFEAKTRGLTDYARAQIKRRWGTMQEVLSSQSRLEKIAADILLDMETKPRLNEDRGNALLVCSSIYQACKFYEIFSRTPLKGKCAIVTSYRPNPADIAGEESGEGATEKLEQFQIYRRMLAEFFGQDEDSAMRRVEEFETLVKQRFVESPAQMKLLIVVDKLLTGFDAPPATYLYIDKPMRDHGLFQAICRVNRLHDEDKTYGYIIDYKDLFNSLQTAITDYTSGAFAEYDPEDIRGVLEDRLAKDKKRLDEALEQVRAICEPVSAPRDTQAFLDYFVAEDSGNFEQIKANESRRVALYKAVSSLVRAYANLADEITSAGYSNAEAKTILEEVRFYESIRQQIKLASGDYVDMKLYEPAMRHLLDTYIQAEDSKLVATFDQGLVKLFVEGGLANVAGSVPEKLAGDPLAMTEAIENNIRRLIIDEQPVNPKYYEKMSALLDELIKLRKAQAIEYAEYMKKLQELARQVLSPETGDYPPEINTPGLRALYDNTGQDVSLALKLDKAIRSAIEHNWRGDLMKERAIMAAIYETLGEKEEIEPLVEKILEILREPKNGY
ncbi:MAG: HsdR family type I site-specific deoxyribonuclease [Anaerolineales bacterium]